MLKLSLHRLAPIVAASIGALPAHAACSADEPVATARRFYSAHRNFYAEETTRIGQLASPRLLAALDKELKCSRGEICAIEADPWMDAQDGDMAQPVNFALASNSGLLAKVRMTYTFVLSRSQRRQQAVTLVLQRESPSGCWLIGDLVGPKGKSLVSTLEKWHSHINSGR